MLTLDVLHHHVRHSLVGGAAVDQPRDVGMVERGENPPLFRESCLETRIEQGSGHDLDGDVLLEGPVRARREVDDAHAAAADLSQRAVLADQTALQFLPVNGLEDGPPRIGAGERRRLQELARRLVGAEQLFDFAPHLGVGCAGLQEPAFPCLHWQEHGGVKQRLETCPPLSRCLVHVRGSVRINAVMNGIKQADLSVTTGRRVVRNLWSEGGLPRAARADDTTRMARRSAPGRGVPLVRRSSEVRGNGREGRPG